MAKATSTPPGCENGPRAEHVRPSCDVCEMAVIGMSCSTAGVDDVAELWAMLHTRGSQHRTVPWGRLCILGDRFTDWLIAGRSSHHFGWSGPAMALDTACSSSGPALHQACRALAYGDCEHILSVIRGSQTLGYMPNLAVDVSWTPVDDAARVLADLAVTSEPLHPVYHLSNYKRQPRSAIAAWLAENLRVSPSRVIPVDGACEGTRRTIA
ncbi:hypothetical protein M409DRAFT_50625 [Zasmidium cellare ATCC 36951]|uniref:Ketosynthase family 3 (KS3) domain-containing protein n=1 Tax=Zasmidium cellare ATCC 36951 TaxID=1080233 RepID=A0A6A6D0Q0_ZASCE|nr:uncharacterized protein M409DRAFT_50625 [Zasmidium cellare ATCC 36951]KAF2172030.1 hypothetical protein M409DRAFT_50625 [Zasmidium cellare ATCC 36951]